MRAARFALLVPMRRIIAGILIAAAADASAQLDVTFTRIAIGGPFSGDALPDGARFSGINTAGIDGGVVYFTARGVMPPPGGGVPIGFSGFFRWTPDDGISILAMTRDPLPDGSGDVWVGEGSSADASLGVEDGRVAFLATYTFAPFAPTNPTNRMCATDLTSVTLGDLAIAVKTLVTDTPGFPGIPLDIVGDVDLGGGVIAFAGSGAFGAADGVFATLPGDPDSLRAVILEGDAVPGRPGEFFDDMTEASCSPSGDVAFYDQADATGRTGIYAEIGGTLRAVAEGDEISPSSYAPGSYVWGNVTSPTFFWSTFRDPVFDSIDGSTILFKGIVNNAGTQQGAPRGLYLYDTATGDIEIVADGNTPVPTAPAQRFYDFGDLGNAVEGRRVVFAGDYFRQPFASRFSLFLWDDGELHTIAREGQALPGAPGTISTIVLTREGLDGDRVVFRANLSDGSNALYLAEFALPCGPADLDASGTIDINDFFAFLALFQDGDDRADFTGEGDIDTNDFFAFLAAYQLGC